MTPKEVLALCKSKSVQLVDVKFCDFLGTWQHFCAPVSELSEEVFEEGLGFDGSSIRGWKSIESSDMLLILDPATAIIDPFPQVTTLSIVADAVDTITREPYSRDPRNIARKAEAYLKQTGIADTAYFGPEAEFFIFDDVRFGQTATAPITTSIATRASGTVAAKSSRTSATKFATRRVTSPSPRRILRAISATK